MDWTGQGNNLNVQKVASSGELGMGGAQRENSQMSPKLFGSNSWRKGVVDSLQGAWGCTASVGGGRAHGWTC